MNIMFIFTVSNCEDGRFVAGGKSGSRLGRNLRTAELCFGAALTLPGEFITVQEPPPQEFVNSLRAAPPPPSTRPWSYAQLVAAPPTSLFQAKFVYIHYGRHGAVPTAPLSGP
jgi:hypothetical protein